MEVLGLLGGRDQQRMEVSAAAPEEEEPLYIMWYHLDSTKFKGSKVYERNLLFI